MLKDDARKWYDLGLNIVPMKLTLESDGKFSKKSIAKWKQWETQRQTPEEFDLLPWSQTDRFAVVCGTKTEHGFFGALDVDDVESLPSEFSVYPTFTEKSPNGFHLFFWSECPVKSIPLNGFELKGENRLCTIYSDVIGEIKTVLDLEVIFKDLASKLGFKKTKTKLKVFNTSIEELLAEGVSEGERDNTAIFLASKLRVNGKTKDETTALMLNWNQKNLPPLSDQTILEKVESAYKNGEPYFDKKDDYELDEKRNIIANDLLTLEHFICLRDTEQLFIYRDGIYIEGAETFIREYVNKSYEGLQTVTDQNEIINKIKVSSYQYRKIFDSPKNLICLKNGIFDFDTWILSPHDPSKYFRWKIPLEYKPDATCPKIDKFFTEIAKDDKMICAIYMLLGYCLYQDYPIRNFFLFIGDGNNGKSTLIRLLQEFLGKENTSGIDFYKLNERFQAVNLEGKFANLVADLPVKTLKNTGMLKKLCGEDSISAEKKYVTNQWLFTNFAKLIFSCNKPPEIEDESEALYHRLLIFTFPNKFADDSHFYDNLVSSDEFSGLLNKGLNSLKELLKVGQFPNDLPSEEKRELFAVLGSDPIRGFHFEMLEQNYQWEITFDELYTEYIIYCKSRNLPIRDISTFSKKLRTLIEFTENVTPLKDGKRKRALIGIKIKGKDNVGKPLLEKKPSPEDLEIQKQRQEVNEQKKREAEEIRKAQAENAKRLDNYGQT